jgi:hypothetical protein
MAVVSYGKDLASNGSISKIVTSPIGDGDHAKPALVPEIDLQQAAPLPENIQEGHPPPQPK